MIRLCWFAAEAVRAFGWRGLVGVALVVASAVFYVANWIPLNERVAALKAETPTAYERQRELKRMAAAQDPAAQLAKFYQHFMTDEPLTDWLGRLYGIGDAYKLTLSQAEYRASDERGLKLSQYQIVVPVTATYPQLKLFLAAVLNEIPVISLDSVTLQRRRIGDATIDAQLQFTLYLPERS